MAGSHQYSKAYTGAVVVMGVTGWEETTIGQATALRLHASFAEGDQLHLRNSIAGVSLGEPLTNEERWRWLAQVGESLRGATGVVASCSAPKRGYREAIGSEGGRPVSFVHQHGTSALLVCRIAQRTGHVMPASLLDSQLAPLEMPVADETVLTLDVDGAPESIVCAAETFLRKGPHHAP